MHAAENDPIQTILFRMGKHNIFSFNKYSGKKILGHEQYHLSLLSRGMMTVEKNYNR
jgi:hypothetical protein